MWVISHAFSLWFPLNVIFHCCSHLLDHGNCPLSMSWKATSLNMCQIKILFSPNRNVVFLCGFLTKALGQFVDLQQRYFDSQKKSTFKSIQSQSTMKTFISYDAEILFCVSRLNKVHTVLSRWRLWLITI